MSNLYTQKAASRIVSKREGCFTPVGTHQTDATVSTATELFPATTLPDEQENLVNCILIQANIRDVRYTLDGTDPTATTGFLLTAGSSPSLFYLPAGIRLKVIETVASATVQFQYGRV
jgi:hypothetical protein